jgi:hypothetical protein
VYTNTQGTFSGRYLDAAGGGNLLVVDSNPDNYGSYAGDGLPDWWQVQYFGVNNPDAGPGTDLDDDKQNNLFEYVAGTDPTNAVSCFNLSIAPVPDQPRRMNVIFNPRHADRTYAVQYGVALDGGSFSNLTGTATSDNGLERTVTDLDATNTAKFYRVQIAKP